MEKSINDHDVSSFLNLPHLPNRKYLKNIYLSLNKNFSNSLRKLNNLSYVEFFWRLKKRTVASKKKLIAESNCHRYWISKPSIMIIVILAVIANNAVFASQRDPLKMKNSYNKDISGHEISNNNAVDNLPIHDQGIVKKYGSPRKIVNEAINSSRFSNVDTKMTDSKNIVLETILENNTTPKIFDIKHTNSAFDKIPSNLNVPLSKVNSQKLNMPGVLNVSGTVRNSMDFSDDVRNGPYFDKSASKNVTALLGKTAYLNCRVKNLGNKTMLLQVSWVRHRDIHLLTVGRYTYTSDQRFRAIHQPQTEDWILQIKYPQHRDSGVYECQVSTTPHMSHYIHLNVVEPSTEIVGAPDLYIESGSTINLTCVVLNSPEPPAYIFWNHNDAIINYDSPRGGVSVLTIKGETTTSFLLIKSAKPSDSGHYQCNPSNAKPKLVTVHVLNGVSHSVSRGNPSSNAARGTNASSHVSESLPFSLYVTLCFYVVLCQTFSATTVQSCPIFCEKIINKLQTICKKHFIKAFDILFLYSEFKISLMRMQIYKYQNHLDKAEHCINSLVIRTTKILILIIHLPYSFYDNKR